LDEDFEKPDLAYARAVVRHARKELRETPPHINVNELAKLVKVVLEAVDRKRRGELWTRGTTRRQRESILKRLGGMGRRQKERTLAAWMALPSLPMLHPSHIPGDLDIPFPEASKVTDRLGVMGRQEATVRVMEYLWVRACLAECEVEGAARVRDRIPPVNTRLFAVALLATYKPAELNCLSFKGRNPELYSESASAWTIGKAIANAEKWVRRTVHMIEAERRARIIQAS
jgi:hypothetical protein